MKSIKRGSIFVFFEIVHLTTHNTKKNLNVDIHNVKEKKGESLF